MNIPKRGEGSYIHRNKTIREEKRRVNSLSYKEHYPSNIRNRNREISGTKNRKRKNY